MKRKYMDRFHRHDRMDRGHLRRHRRRRHLHLGPAAQSLQLLDPRLLRLRPPAARHPDLLGHCRDLLSRHPHHGRSGLGQCRPALSAHHRRVRDAGAAVRGHGADLHAVRQGARHLLRQRPHLRPAPADLAVLRGRLGRRRLRGAADRHPHLPADLPARADAANPKSSRSSEARDEHRRRRHHRLRLAVRADAAARAGRHGDGPRRRVRLRLSGQRHRRRSSWSARPRCAR